MISLIHPSRGRPEKSFATVNNWLLKSGAHRSQIEVIVSVDANDPQLTKYLEYYKDAIVGDNTCVVEATNRAAKVSKGDILIYLSDDFDCPEGWWEKVTDEFEEVNLDGFWVNSDKPTLLKVDDCLQKFDVPVLTIPIMNRSLYERLGYFWFPEYKSMFCDVDLFYTCRKLASIRNAEHLKFPHNHASIGKAPDDETYRRSAANWKQGEDLFRKRQAAGFPI